MKLPNERMISLYQESKSATINQMATKYGMHVKQIQVLVLTGKRLVESA